MKKCLLAALLTCSSLIINAIPQQITGNRPVAPLKVGPCFPDNKPEDKPRCLVGTGGLPLGPIPIGCPGSTSPSLTMPGDVIRNPLPPHLGGTWEA